MEVRNYKCLFEFVGYGIKEDYIVRFVVLDCENMVVILWMILVVNRCLVFLWII